MITSITNITRHPWFALALRLSLCIALVGALTLLLPGSALAQDGGGGGGGNPFADQGTRSAALEFVKSLRFWVWISAGVGFFTFIVAYALQGIVPSFYQQFRDYLRMGVLILIGFGFFFQLIISQANK